MKIKSKSNKTRLSFLSHSGTIVLHTVRHLFLFDIFWQFYPAKAPDFSMTRYKDHKISHKYLPPLKGFQDGNRIRYLWDSRDCQYIRPCASKD